jgi:phage terminase large subunit GpA-like protein
MSKFSHTLTGMAFGASIIWSALAAQAVPPPQLSVSEWAAANRFVSAESGSPHPGKWSNDLTPYLVEPMDACGVDHPAGRVDIRGGAQTGKSECGQNAIGHCIDTAPRPIMVMLPSRDEVTKYNNVKFDQMVEATPSLTKKVLASRSRSESGSTTTFKRYRGGYLAINSAGSSKGLQMVSYGFLIKEELAEYGEDVGGRGAPEEQAEARGIAWGEDFKNISISTTGQKGDGSEITGCKITAAFEAGDQRWPYGSCPHCTDRFALKFEHLNWYEGRAVAACPSCGGLIEQHQKPDYLESLRHGWIATFPSEDEANPAPPEIIAQADFANWRARPTEGRSVSFHIWQGVSAFSTWEYILRQWEKAQTDPEKLKTFYQQILAEPYEAVFDKPEHEEMFRVCTPDAEGKVALPFVLERGTPPDWAPFLTLSIDQQADRLEWAAYAHGPQSISVRFDYGVLSGSPDDDKVWTDLLTQVLIKKYETKLMKPRGFDLMGVDTGGHSTQQAYRFVKSLSGQMMALKGKPNDKHAPALSLGSRVKVKTRNNKSMGSIQLYLVGTDGMKQRVYYGLGQMMGAGESARPEPKMLGFTPESSLQTFKQITAENPEPQKNGGVKWVKPANQPNEQLDLAVYAIALAINAGMDDWTPEQWREMAQKHLRDATQIGMGPLEALMVEPSAERTAALEEIKKPQREAAAALFANLSELNENG